MARFRIVSEQNENEEVFDVRLEQQSDGGVSVMVGDYYILSLNPGKRRVELHGYVCPEAVGLDVTGDSDRVVVVHNDKKLK